MATRNIQDAVEELQQKWPLIEKDFEQENPGWNLILVCVLRSVEEQQGLWKIGRSLPGAKVTNKSGIFPSISKHNPTIKYPKSRAIDVGVLVGGKYMTKNSYYLPLGALAKRYGLVWGGDWFPLKDSPHLEVVSEE
jgi:hypothetical protein